MDKFGLGDVENHRYSDRKLNQRCNAVGWQGLLFTTKRSLEKSGVIQNLTAAINNCVTF